MNPKDMNLHAFFKHRSRPRGIAFALAAPRFWDLVVAAFLMTMILAGSALRAEIESSLSIKDVKNMSEEQKREKLFVIRSKQIPLLEDFLRKYPDSPRVPETRLRLGEALFETAKFHQIKGDTNRARSQLTRAISILEDLRKSFPGFAKLDQALFILANTYIEEKQMSKAGSVLAEIAQKFPESPILKEASLLLGDYYFETNNYAMASRHYSEAVQDGKISAYVNYKLAWASMNQNQPARALKYFEAALQNAQEGGSDYSREAAREMVWPALEVYTHRRVVSYLEQTLKSPELVELAISQLAKGLMQKSRLDLASEMYETLQVRFPQSAQVSEWAIAQLKAEETLGRTAKVREIVARMQGSQASSEVQKSLMASARKFHSQAQKAKDKPSDQARFYDLAIGYYQSFLQGATAAEATEAQFYLGEALYARNRFAEALTAYAFVASTLESPLSKTAVWNQYLTAEKLADGFRYQGKTLKAPSANDERFIALANELQAHPGLSIDQKRKVSYQAARLLYQLNDFDRALPAFQALADQHAGTQEGKLSAKLVVDIFNLRKDYQNLAASARKYQGSLDAASRAQLAGIEEKAMLKTITEEEKSIAGLSGESKLVAQEAIGEKYLQYLSQYPSSNQTPDVLWAAIQNFADVYLKRGDKQFPKLRSAFQQLNARHRSSRHYAKAVTLMGDFVGRMNLPEGELQEFRSFRDEWLRDARQVSPRDAGPYLMTIYRMSTDSQKRQMLPTLAKLPASDLNREANAFGKLGDVYKLYDRFAKVQLNQLASLQRNTAQKVNLLEQLQRDVTELARLKVAEPVLAGIELLAKAHFEMASEIRTAPIPKTLTGELIGKYQAAVSEKAKEFEAKGQAARELAEKRRQELQTGS